jgi:sulfoxide reductase heme-binding subunit YedZ
MAGVRKGRLLVATVTVNGAVPLVMLIWDWWRGGLGVNPVDFVTRTTGTLTLVFLIATLAISTLRRIGAPGVIVKARRVLGLYAGFYGLLHFMTWLWLDKFFHLQDAVADVLGRPFIAVGLLAFILMVPMAITSTDRAIRRLGGKQWRRIHRRIYFVAFLGMVHYVLLVKVVTGKQLGFGLVIGALLGERLMHSLRDRKKKSVRIATGEGEAAGG